MHWEQFFQRQRTGYTKNWSGRVRQNFGNWLTSGAIFSTATYRVYKKLVRAYEAKLGELGGTLDYLKEIQRGTIRVEQTGSFFDDTFHGQQLIASTPKKHVNEEQLESGQQEQEAEDN